jgi:hypothetical protein
MFSFLRRFFWRRAFYTGLWSTRMAIKSKGVHIYKLYFLLDDFITWIASRLEWGFKHGTK